MMYGWKAYLKGYPTMKDSMDNKKTNGWNETQFWLNRAYLKLDRDNFKA